MIGGSRSLGSPLGFNYQNSTGEAVPPFACMELTGSSANDGEQLWTVAKPSSTTSSGNAVINEGVMVEDSRYGTWRHPAETSLVLVNNPSSLSIGDEIGPVDGQWYMDSSGTGYIFSGEDTNENISISTAKSAWVKSAGGSGGLPAIHAVTPSGGIAAASGDGSAGSPYNWGSEECDLIDPATGERYSPNKTQRIYNQVNVAIGGGLLIGADPDENGEYFIHVAWCPPQAPPTSSPDPNDFPDPP